MVSNEPKSPTRVASRVIIGVLVAGIIGAGLLLVFSQRSANYRLAAGNGNQSKTTADAVKLSDNYRASFKGVLNDYLSQVRSADGLKLVDFAGQTKKAKARLLALAVPPESKDLHLSAVIILSDLEKMPAAQSELIGSGLDKLAKLITDF
ncbi:MAG: hypothetical protein WC518_02405 [Patescibacteria group bacterium]